MPIVVAGGDKLLDGQSLRGSTSAYMICAGALFSLLAAFSLYQFTKTGGEAEATPTWSDRLMRIFRTKQEFVDKMTPHKKIRVSWLVKGEAFGILADPPAL